ncbi:MAG: hypothetical protein AAGI91_03130 [Bacteroidota bacterium]
MSPFLIPIVAIIAWAVVQVTRNRAKGGPALAELDALRQRLDASEAERERLTARIQNLEAIVTTETFDLLKQDPEAAKARLDLPDDPEPLPEEEAARLAKRMRS